MRFRVRCSTPSANSNEYPNSAYQPTLKTLRDKEYDMTYTLTIGIESYEFGGEFYVVGDKYDTGE